MPRRKRYTTKQQQLDAARLKAAKYYQKNREAIKAKKCAYRVRLKENQQQNRLEARRERIEEQQESRAASLHAAKRQEHRSDPVIMARNVENHLNNFTDNCVSQYFDSICRKLFVWDRKSVSPLKEPFAEFHAMRNKMELLLETIGREYNPRHPDYTEGLKLLVRLNRITDGIDELQKVAGNGTMHLFYMTNRLGCQKQLWRAWVDGVTGPEAFEYTS
ncbi:hypothetical protein VNI00_007302 [Paramarasmius palmivorus]|uniref:Uncharacterized protein n=1 Tax=Paramarasmius palmivorus TaxID=297713 RepID=A0AAW0D2K7_9AGAR